MSKTLIYIGMAVGGWIGWWLGEKMGFELMGTFLVSSLGSFAGVYLTWRFTRDYLE